MKRGPKSKPNFLARKGRVVFIVHNHSGQPIITYATRWAAALYCNKNTLSPQNVLEVPIGGQYKLTYKYKLARSASGSNLHIL